MIECWCCADHSERGRAPQQLSAMAAPAAENWGGAQVCRLNTRRNARLGSAEGTDKRTDQIGVTLSCLQCVGYGFPHNSRLYNYSLVCHNWGMQHFLTLSNLYNRGLQRESPILSILNRFYAPILFLQLILFSGLVLLVHN